MTFPRPALRPLAALAIALFVLAAAPMLPAASCCGAEKACVPGAMPPALKVPQKRLEFPKTTLWHFLESMRTTTGVPFKVDPVVRDKKITYISDMVTWEHALSELTSEYELGSRYCCGAVWVHPLKGATPAFVEEMTGPPAAPPPQTTTLCIQVPVAQPPAAVAAALPPPPPPVPAWDADALAGVGFVAGTRADIQGDDLLRENLKSWSGSGMLILEVVPETPAAESGLMRGDVVRTFDGLPVAGPGDILAVTGAAKTTMRYVVGYDRAGESRATVLRYTPPGVELTAHDRKAGIGDPKGRYTAERRERDSTSRTVAESDPQQLFYQAPSEKSAPEGKKETTGEAKKPETAPAPAPVPPAEGASSPAPSGETQKPK